MKVCRECQVEKSDEDFTPPRLKCKVCVSARKKAWADENREHVLKQKRDWHEANKDASNARRSAQYHADPEPVRARRRERYYENPDAAVEAACRWQQENREHRANYMRGYRAALRGIPSEPYATEQVLAKTDGKCGVCGVGLRLEDYGREGWHVDHIIPLSAGAEGGCTDTLENVQAACAPCNIQKGAQMPESVEAS